MTSSDLPNQVPQHETQSALDGARAGLLPTGATPATPLFDATALFGNAQVVLIRHGVDTYRLCRTRQGKLILTK